MQILTKRKRLKKRLILLAILASGFMLIKLLIWDNKNNRWIIQDIYYSASLDAKLTIAPEITQVSANSNNLIPTEINDASKLNPTNVAGILQPTAIDEIKAIVKSAVSQGKKISLSGARHSMGGQIAYANSLHLDLSKLDQIRYHPENQTVTVQSGATWKQIQRQLGQQGRAVRVMQDSNIFSVGGSMSVNAHGKDPRFGSLIESVNSFKLVNAQGEEIECSRQQNSELFKTAIGGMGIFGIITEVNLKTIENSTYTYSVIHKPSAEIVPFMEAQIKRSNLEMIEAQMSVDHANFLTEAQIYYFDRTTLNPSLKDDVSGENSIWLRKFVYRTSRESDWGKQFRWFMQKQLGPTLDAKQISRNSGMAAPFRTLELDDPSTTDVLQEYFVPLAHVDQFLEAYKQLLQRHQMELINVTVRKVNQDQEALVSYATEDMYAFVSYYRISRHKSDAQKNAQFTRIKAIIPSPSFTRCIPIFRNYFNSSSNTIRKRFFITLGMPNFADFRTP
jgi:decaprenylphospho-beta-D-ribofuranose 2-oxidase